MKRQEQLLDNFLTLLGEQRVYAYMVDNKEQTTIKPYRSNDSLKFPMPHSTVLKPELNVESTKMGIYIAVNTYHLDYMNLERGIGRTYSNLKEVRAFTADMDCPKGDDITEYKRDTLQKMFAGDYPEPSAVVDTKNGYHAWWFLDEPEKVIPENMNILRAIQEEVVTKIGGDPAAKDLTRVLRYPGSIHWKSEPYPITMVHCIGTTYTLMEMQEAFPPNHIARKREKADIVPLLINIESGARNNTAKNILCSVMGSLKPPLWPYFAKAGIREWNRHLKDPLEDSELMLIYESIAKLAIQNWWIKDSKGIWNKKY